MQYNTYKKKNCILRLYRETIFHLTHAYKTSQFYSL